MSKIAWTVEGISGEQFLDLCRREKAGELWIEQFGPATGSGVWNVVHHPGKAPDPIQSSLPLPNWEASNPTVVPNRQLPKPERTKW